MPNTIYKLMWAVFVICVGALFWSGGVVALIPCAIGCLGGIALVKLITIKEQSDG